MLTYTAFEGFKRLSRGDIETVALDVAKHLKKNSSASVLIFSDSSGKQMDLDLSGSERDIIGRLKVFATPEASTASGPGRPKLGVVSREVSLLPQHWEWLATQTGGASATIRRLVDEKMKAPLNEKDRAKQAQESAYRFLTAIAGNLPNFEEAIRYMYRRDKKKFKTLVAEWPSDLLDHTMILTEAVFSQESK